MIGIYKLHFMGTDKVYIGQSTNIQGRYTEHKRLLVANKHSKKLAEAYNIYGTPLLEVVEECPKEVLDLREEYYIEQFNSVSQGFNTSKKAAGGVSKGEDHGHAVYSNIEVLEAFWLLVTKPDLSLKEVANLTSIKYDTIKQIARGVQHTWLKDIDNNAYNTMLSYKFSRATIGNSAKGKGKIYPHILSPGGIEYEVTNCKAFAEEQGLFASNLGAVLRGNRKSCAGWRLV